MSSNQMTRNSNLGQDPEAGEEDRPTVASAAQDNTSAGEWLEDEDRKPQDDDDDKEEQCKEPEYGEASR